MEQRVFQSVEIIDRWVLVPAAGRNPGCRSLQIMSADFLILFSLSFNANNHHSLSFCCDVDVCMWCVSLSVFTVLCTCVFMCPGPGGVYQLKFPNLQMCLPCSGNPLKIIWLRCNLYEVSYTCHRAVGSSIHIDVHTLLFTTSQGFVSFNSVTINYLSF